ncbi:hypothetical protein PGT21_019566 [Puccinia graminis f. sp. tritici]|uniref:Uncharacterized protein n=1 Tax=Puccinia graminis f. sp. tritici TaxID=56615 RepID=A0A5B0QJ47_PUCGR|nr:hypothetical protein PGT21_019566 [Puccinia graminis f. sp. tritici]
MPLVAAELDPVPFVVLYSNCQLFSTPSPIILFVFVILHPPAGDRLLSIDARNSPMSAPAFNDASIGSAALSVDRAEIPTNVLADL